ncbi:hypothetical protein ACJX0J_037947, partial [Zea mays]
TVQVNPIAIDGVSGKEDEKEDHMPVAARDISMALHEALLQIMANLCQCHCCQQDRYMDLPSKNTSSIQFLPQVPFHTFQLVAAAVDETDERIFSLAVRLLVLIYSGGGMAAEEESFFTLHKNLDLY